VTAAIQKPLLLKNWRVEKLGHAVVLEKKLLPLRYELTD
jgi:hypothetical protein